MAANIKAFFVEPQKVFPAPSHFGCVEGDVFLRIGESFDFFQKIISKSKTL